MRADRAVLALALALAAGPASAYTLLGWDWSWQAVPLSTPFLLNASSFPAAVGAPANVEAALRRGLAAWGDQGGADFSFTDGGLTTATSFTDDGVFVAAFSGATAGGSTLALAQSWGVADRMTDCDIRFYRANAQGVIAWSADPAGAPPGAFDLEATAVHEFGHCAGLDHSNDPNAIMTAFAVPGTGPAARRLAADDQAGLQAIYGLPGARTLSLAVDGMLEAGDRVTFVVGGALAGERVRIGVSTLGTSPGATCLPLLGGSCLDLVGPVDLVVKGRAGPTGAYAATVRVPAVLAGSDVQFQAVALPSGLPAVVSDVLPARILPSAPACAAGLVRDCGGACYPATWVGDGGCDDGTLFNWGAPDFSCAVFAFDEGDCAAP